MLEDSYQKQIIKLFRRLLVISILMTSIITTAEQNTSEANVTATVQSANLKLKSLMKNLFAVPSNSNTNSTARLEKPKNWDQFLPSIAQKPPNVHNQADTTNSNQVAH